MKNAPGSDSRGGDSDESRDDPHANLYVPEGHLPDPTVREPISEDDSWGEDERFEELENAIEEVVELQSQRYDTVAEVLHHYFLDVVPGGDDLYSKSPFTIRSMANIWVYRLVAPSEGYSMVSWEQLEDSLDDSEFAEMLKFDPSNTPSERTMREQWWDRVRPAFRDHIRHTAAELAVMCEEYGVETAENIRENLIEDFREDTESEIDPIGVMEQEIKDDAYTVQADIIRDVCSYDRDDSLEWEDELITDAAAHMCRKNEYSEQGIKRMAKDYGLIEEREDGSEEWNVFTQQTFRRTVRNVERTKVEPRNRNDDDRDGARWIPPHELVDHEIARGTEREAIENAWTIDPHDPDGETAIWHCRTEDAIEQQVEWLKEQGVIGSDETFNLRVDYTNHDHSRHSSVDSDPPVGVHKQSHLETGYAWKELQATIKINGRAFIIATMNYTPQNDQFQGVRYLLDRARELVNIDTVLADAEFVDNRICEYILHCGCDYALRKGATESVKDTVAGFDDRADWENDWTMISGGREKEHDTTLVGLEKDFKSVPSHKKSSGEDDEPETTLDDFADDGEEPEEGQMTLEQAIDEPQEDNEQIDYFCVITSKDVHRAGIDPDEKPIGHDPEGSAWGIARLYRDRWGVETAFRDKKNQFAAKTRSRDLGYRRYLWMMENLLYNGWVMLNSAVSDQSPARDDDEIVEKQATYLDELDRRVLSGLSLNLEFPDQEFD